MPFSVSTEMDTFRNVFLFFKFDICTVQDTSSF